MNYNFTDRVRKVLAMAREEAIRLQHDYVGTEHILLGLIREGEGVAAAVLTPPDIFSQLAMAIPVTFLYIASVLVAMFATRRRDRDQDDDLAEDRNDDQER